MNIALSNWITYNFQVGKEAELKLKIEEEKEGRSTSEIMAELQASGDGLSQV